MTSSTFPDRTREELSLSEERFRILTEISADTIWQLDRDFRITSIGNTDQAMRGFSPEEVIGASFFSIMSSESGEEVRRICLERFGEGTGGIRTASCLCEVQLKHKDGSHFLAEIIFKPLPNGEDEITGYVGVIRNTNERRKFEKELLAEKHKLMKTLSISDGYQAQLQEFNNRIKGMVQDEERSRLYRDLHDGAGQSLYGVCLHLKMLADGKGGYDDPKPLAAQLAREVADVAAELRDIAHQLRPSYLKEIPLDKAIERRCDMLGRRGVPVKVVCKGDFVSLPHEISDNFYRIAQEAVANAARHAGARQITVSLTNSGNMVQLVVADDGSGMQETARTTSGMGQRIMRERANLIGAILNISSSSSSGTRISVTRENV